MSYKHRLQYTPFAQRRRELRSLAQKYLEKEASRCEEFALYTKKELRHYIARFLKKIHKQLSGIRGALLLSLLILYHCADILNLIPKRDETPMPMPEPMPEPKRIFVANDGVNRVYISDGNGGFTGTNISADTNVSQSIAVGDLNGDGDLDVVVANYGEKNRVYLGNGSGGFAEGTNISADANNSGSIALGDVDGDGDLDIVVANDEQKNRVYMNNGVGADGTVSFTRGSDISSDANASNSIALGDVDGDGDLDIVVANSPFSNSAYYSSSRVSIPGFNRVYLSNGTGGFTRGSDISTDDDPSSSIALGDLDGDGNLDIVVANAGQVNKVYLGDGSGGFTAGTDISTDENDSRSIALDDVDGDGDLDIVVANSPFSFSYSTGGGSSSRVSVPGFNRVYLSNGTGDFTDVIGSDISTDENDSNSIAVGDLDGDGDLDIVVANNGQVNRVYKNDGMGGFTSGSDLSADENLSRSIVIK